MYTTIKIDKQFWAIARINGTKILGKISHINYCLPYIEVRFTAPGLSKIIKEPQNYAWLLLPEHFLPNDIKRIKKIIELED